MFILEDSETLFGNDQDELSHKFGSLVNDSFQSAETKCTRTSESFDAPGSIGDQKHSSGLSSFHLQPFPSILSGVTSVFDFQ